MKKITLIKKGDELYYPDGRYFGRILYPSEEYHNKGYFVNKLFKDHFDKVFIPYDWITIGEVQ